MKISNKMPNAMPNAENAKASSASKLGLEELGETKKGKAAAQATGSSRIDVSSRAQEMAKAKEIASGGDDIDEAKVARLQKLVDEGKYKVDADLIADRLLDEHTKMS